MLGLTNQAPSALWEIPLYSAKAAKGWSGGVCCFVVFLFPVLQVFGIPNSPRSLDLDDRQGFIASSAMQQKKKAKAAKGS